MILTTLSMRTAGHLVSRGALAVALVTAGSAFAQAAPAPDQAIQTPTPTASDPVSGIDQDAGDDIVVTGFRASLDNALNLKRQDAGIIDAIVAEDIADFPDSNLAESLQRVPGVALARGEGGEGRNISVRGLGPGFTRVRLNGMEAQSTTGRADIYGATAPAGRSFDFSVFASELFNNLTVRKTSSADVEEGSLGATVDLRTSRPFDFREDFTIAGNVQGAYNDRTEKVDPRAALLVSRTFGDGTFGILASAAYSKRRVLEEGYSAVNVLRGTDDGGFCSPVGVTPITPPPTGAGNAAAGTSATNCTAGVPRLPNTPANVAAYNLVNNVGTFIPRIPRYVRSDVDYDRFGATVAAQWAPRDGTTISLDGLLSIFDVQRRDSYIAGLSFGRAISNNGKPSSSVLEAEVDENGTLVFGRFNDVDVRSETLLDVYKTTFTQGTFTVDHEISDTLKMNTLVGYSRSNFENPIRTTINIDSINADGFTLDFRENNNVPAIGYGIDINNPASFAFGPTVGRDVFGTITMRKLNVTNDYFTGEGSLDWTPTPDFIVRVGGQYRRSIFDSDHFERLNANLTPALPAGTTLASLTTMIDGFGKGLDGAPSSWVIADYDKFNEAFNLESNTGIFQLFGPESGGGRGGTRSVDEEVRAGFLQVDFRTDALPILIRGNAGVRYVNTRQETVGFQSSGAAPGYVEVTTNRSYDDWLPSLNLTGEITPDVLVRFSAARVMSRPELGALTPGGSINNTTGDVGAGNPNLNPIRADTLDLSAEWYPQQGAIYSIGLFRKNIGSFIQTLRTRVPFSELGLPANVLAGTTLTVNDTFTFSRPLNTQGGELRGFEINIQQPLTFLPGPLRNTGILFNYTYVESEIDYVFSITNVPGQQPVTTFVRDDLVGLSPKQINGTFYYDDTRLSARISAAYRDRYLTAVPSGGPDSDVQGVRKSLFWDAQISYQITDNFKISLEGLNLFNEPTSQFIDNDRDDTYFHTLFGRTITLGLSAKL